MATIDTANNLYNALSNGSTAVNGRSQADMNLYGRTTAVLLNAITAYRQVFAPVVSTVVFRNQGAPGAPGTLQGDWAFSYQLAFNAANAACTSAGASGPVTFATTAAALAAMQARIATALALQTASPSVTAGLNAALTALNLAYGSGLPTQNDATAQAALQAAATTALTAAVTDAQAVCTYLGINQSGGGN